MPVVETVDYRLITQQSEFDQLCQQFKRCTVLALDTEFVRTRTLQPLLGLIQVFDGKQTYLIDPLELDNFDAFAQLLTDKNIIKVLHACSEDLEVFLSAMKVAPTPIFDTQYAANVLDKGPTLGYARLVELECGLVLDKGESRTDWLARPLSDKQLHYASNDVVYLYQVYEKLSPEIESLGKTALLYEELEALVEKKSASLPAEFAYLTISNNWRLNDRQRYVLKNLAEWRLNTARTRNMAINFVVKESNLFAIANALPSSKNQLTKLGLMPQEIRKHGDTLLAIVAQSKQDFDTDPNLHNIPVILRLNDVKEYKKVLTQLKQLCENIAAKSAIRADLLASKKQLNQVLKWWWFDVEETSAQGLLPDLLTGWRRPLFERPLLQILGDPKKAISGYNQPR